MSPYFLAAASSAGVFGSCVVRVILLKYSASLSILNIRGNKNKRNSVPSLFGKSVLAQASVITLLDTSRL